MSSKFGLVPLEIDKLKEGAYSELPRQGLAPLTSAPGLGSPLPHGLGSPLKEGVYSELPRQGLLRLRPAAARFIGSVCKSDRGPLQYLSHSWSH